MSTLMVIDPGPDYVDPLNKNSVSRAIDRHAKQLRDVIVSDISAAEMASWPIKQAQAIAFKLSGNEADAPMIVLEASYRQCTTEDLANMVIAKANVLAGLEAMICGECGRRQDELRNADLAGVVTLAANVKIGWPV